MLAFTGAGSANERQFIAVELSDSTPLQVFSLDPFEEPIGYSLVLGDVRERVIQRFGEPQETMITFEVDRYGGEGSEIRLSTLHYPGLIIKIGDRPGYKRSWLNGLEITGEQYQLKFKLEIGASHQDVLDALQPGNYNDTPGLLKMYEDIWEKRYGDRAENDTRVDGSVGLVFEFDATDRVSKIIWIARPGH